MTPGTPLPSTPAPQKRPNPLVRLAIGCSSLLLIGCVAVAGLAFYENWQQEQNYNAGHQAYMEADCATAVGPLGAAASGDPGTAGSDVALQAQAELEECEALLAADQLDAGGSYGDAMLAYSDILAKYPTSPLQPFALERAQAIGAESDPAELASVVLCNGLDTLIGQQLVAQDAERFPALLYACGQAYETEGDFATALDRYDQVLDEYPGHSLSAEVQQALARAVLAEATAAGAGELPAPVSVGASTASGGLVTVIIQNDSPETLRLVFSGPEVRVEELAPCEGCQEFSSVGPSGCPEQGPIGEYVLAPGTYDVVVRAASGEITPFRGSWELTSGQEYNSCFYLVTTVQ